MFPIERTPEWRRQQQAQIQTPAWQRLTALLTQAGGARVGCIPGELTPEQIDFFVPRAQRFPFQQITSIPGPELECHANAYRYWQANQETTQLCFGMFLCEEAWFECWQVHSWVWMPASQTIGCSWPPQLAEDLMQRRYVGIFITSDGDVEGVGLHEDWTTKNARLHLEED